MRNYRPTIWALVSLVQVITGTGMLVAPSNFALAAYDVHRELAPIWLWGVTWIALGVLAIGARVSPVWDSVASLQFTAARVIVSCQSAVTFGWAAAFIPWISVSGFAALSAVCAWSVLGAIPLVELHQKVRRSGE